MVSLYVHGHKPFQVDAWLMDSISCNFPICFTGLQNELEENMQVLGNSTQKHRKCLLLVELQHEKLRLGREGMSAFPWFPRHSKSKIKTGRHLQSKIELTTGSFLPSASASPLGTARKETIPMVNHGGFPETEIHSFFCLLTWLFPSNSPSLLPTYFYFMKDLRKQEPQTATAAPWQLRVPADGEDQELIFIEPHITYLSCVSLEERTGEA